MITKEWCKEYALINKGLNADSIFPITWHNSVNGILYPHQVANDNQVPWEAGVCTSLGTLITVPVQTLPTWDCSNCNVSVKRAITDLALTITAVPMDVFKVFNFVTNGSEAYFIPANSAANSSLSFAFVGNFNRMLSLRNNAALKTTAYVFPYVLAGYLSVSGTLSTDYVSLTNQDPSNVQIVINRYGQNRWFNLTETLDYVPIVFDAIKLLSDSTKTVSFVGYAIQKQESSYQNTRTALFTVPILP